MIAKCVVAVVLAGLLAGCGEDDASTTPPVTPSGPYVLVLGTAQDGGFPQIGADHALARAARKDPSLRRYVASLLIVDPRSGKRWLIDATPDLREQVELARGHPPNRKLPGQRPPLCEGIFLTHAHMGHYTGLMHLGREAYGAKNMPVIASEEMASFLENNGPWSLLVKLRNIELRTLRAGEAVPLAEDLSVLAIDVPHRAEFTGTFAFVVKGPSKSLLYIPDIDKWEKWDNKIEDEIGAVNYALLDGTFYENGEIPGRDMSLIPHPFIEESLRRFEPLPASERAKVHFTHLNHTNPASDPNGAAQRKIKAAGCAVAFDGQVFGL